MAFRRRKRYLIILCVGFVISAALELRKVFSATTRNAAVSDSKTFFLRHGRNGSMSLTFDELYSKVQTDRERKWLSVMHSSKINHKRQRFPDVICVGMEKCGTEALARFLENHPLIKSPSSANELHFFSAHYKMGAGYYLRLMPYVTDEEIVMEKSPSYFNLPPLETPRRIKKLLPNVKIILILCDPANRIYSDYVHEKEMKALNGNATFDEILERPLKMYKLSVFDELKYLDPEEACSKLLSLVGRKYSTHIVTGGIYYYCLEHWLAIFRKEQIYIVNGEDLLHRPGRVMEEVQDFIGLPKLLSPEDFAINPNTGFYCYRPRFSAEMDIALQDMLLTGCLDKSKGRTRKRSPKISNDSLNLVKALYQDSNRKLSNLLGKNLGW